MICRGSIKNNYLLFCVERALNLEILVFGFQRSNHLKKRWKTINSIALESKNMYPNQQSESILSTIASPSAIHIWHWRNNTTGCIWWWSLTLSFNKSFFFFPFRLAVVTNRIYNQAYEENYILVWSTSNNMIKRLPVSLAPLIRRWAFSACFISTTYMYQ